MSRKVLHKHPAIGSYEDKFKLICWCCRWMIGYWAWARRWKLTDATEGASNHNIRRVPEFSGLVSEGARDLGPFLCSCCLLIIFFAWRHFRSESELVCPPAERSERPKQHWRIGFMDVCVTRSSMAVQRYDKPMDEVASSMSHCISHQRAMSEP